MAENSELTEEQVMDSVKKLAAYVIKTGVMKEEDLFYALNTILLTLQITDCTVTKEDVLSEAAAIRESAVEDGSYLSQVL